MTATAVASEAGRYSAGGMKAPTDGSLGSARQFVIFHLLDEMFAVPLSEVREIIRMPDVVKVPMSPPALEGLSNLRGSVSAGRIPAFDVSLCRSDPRRLHARRRARSRTPRRPGRGSHG